MCCPDFALCITFKCFINRPPKSNEKPNWFVKKENEIYKKK